MLLESFPLKGACEEQQEAAEFRKGRSSAAYCRAVSDVPCSVLRIESETTASGAFSGSGATNLLTTFLSIAALGVVIALTSSMAH